MNHTERMRQLVNLVNARRVQVGKEPLRTEHIQRAARLILGPEPTSDMAVPFVNPGSWLWGMRIPYALTAKAYAALAGGVEP